jgi:cytochrome c oxidase assembly protein Cox11
MNCSQVVPGETALAFYTARNPTDVPVTGVSTYNVIPFEAGQYFNKIQCFCFEEQLLNPHEEVRTKECFSGCWGMELLKPLLLDVTLTFTFCIPCTYKQVSCSRITVV